MHMAQLMPLPLTVSCFSKIQIGFTFLVPAHLGGPRIMAVKQMCVNLVYVDIGIFNIIVLLSIYVGVLFILWFCQYMLVFCLSEHYVLSVEKHNVYLLLPLMLWRCWLGGRKGIRPVKTEWWGAGMVICLERGAVLHTAQLMPLPLTVSCSSKIQIDFTFLVPAHLGIPGQRAIKRMYVYFICWMYAVGRLFTEGSCGQSGIKVAEISTV